VVRAKTVAVLMLILLILGGVWFSFKSFKRAEGSSDLHEPGPSEAPEATTIPEMNSSLTKPVIRGKFIVELLDEDGFILTSKYSKLLAFLQGPSGGFEYQRVSKVRFRVEGIDNPSFVEVRMTMYKIGDVTQPPLTSSITTTCAPLPPPTVTTTSSPYTEPEPPPEEPEPLPIITTTSPPPGGGPGPPHYYPLGIVADNVLLYDGTETIVSLKATSIFVGYENGIYEVRFWAWVGTGEQTLISDYVTFKIMIYNYRVYWIPE